MENVIKSHLPHEESPSNWSPSSVPLPMAGDASSRQYRVLTGAVALDIFLGFFVGTVPLLSLLFLTAVFMLGDAASNAPGDFSDVQVKGFLILAAAFHGLFCRVCLRAFPGLLWGSLFATLLACIYSVWIMST